MKINLVDITFYLLICIVSVSVISCSDNSTDSHGEITYKSYQVGGCNRQALAKIGALDSCFTYTFDDNLEIDFCLYGNCCPDSNRFITDYLISSDTIFITAVDTAKRLCDCICPYQIHLEFANLEYDRYVLCCDYDDMLSYSEALTRTYSRN